MKYIIYLILVSVIFSRCTSIGKERTSLIGQWQGTYSKKKSMMIEFTVDSILITNYNNGYPPQRRQYIQRDNLLIIKGKYKSDTVDIKFQRGILKLLERRLKGDVEVIFDVDFKRVEKQTKYLAHWGIRNLSKNETASYQIQFAFRPMSLPRSATYYNEINYHWVGKINGDDGTPLYKGLQE